MLTRADIYARKMVNAMHIDYSRRESAWLGEVEGLPRLTVNQHRGEKCFNTWYVDKTPMPSLDVALDVLNGVKTLEEAAAQEIPEHAHRPGKVSIEAQVETVDTALAMVAADLGKIGQSNPRKRNELELVGTRMQAVRATLVWLRDNEASIKQRASY